MDKKANKYRINGIYYRSVIYNAAAEGNLERIKVFTEAERGDPQFLKDAINTPDDDLDDIDRRPDVLYHGLLVSVLKRWMREIVFKKFPLVIAARNGHTHVVEYLIDYGADPSLKGVVEFDKEKIRGTPALWAAAAAGHFDVVKLLIEKANANVNQTTNTNSTPLRGACYDGHVEIAEFLLKHGADPSIPNRHGHTCLMIAAFKMEVEIVRVLLKHNVDVNIKTERGNTALHDAAESGQVEIIEMLLEKGAIMQKDINGVDPIFAAALSGKEKALDALAKNMDDPLRHRDALKLIGCSYADKFMDLSKAMSFWRKAMRISLSPEQWKVVREMELLAEPLEVYNFTQEAHTYSQVVELESNLELQRMQSLLTRERILGPAHSDVHLYLRFRGAVYCDTGDLKKGYEVWKHAMELQQNHFKPLHTGFISTLITFSDTMVMTLNDVANGMHDIDGVRVYFSWIESVFNQICKELERVVEWGDGPLLRETECCGSEPCEHSTVEGELKRITQVALELANLAFRLSLPLLQAKDDEIEQLNIERMMKSIIKLRVPILHYAMEDRENNPEPIVKLPILRQLLDCEPEMNTQDEELNTPLHILLKAKNFRCSLVVLLLDHGANILARNANNETPLSLLRKIAERTDPEKNHIGTMKIGSYLTLRGLASRAMRTNLDFKFVGIEKELPWDLVPFYLLH